VITHPFQHCLEFGNIHALDVDNALVKPEEEMSALHAGVQETLCRVNTFFLAPRQGNRRIKKAAEGMVLAGRFGKAFGIAFLHIHNG
jgi:hypothetical protein